MSIKEPSPLHKCCKANLLHKPSKTVMAAHKKRKLKSPLSTGKPVTTTTLEKSVPSTNSVASTSSSTGDTVQSKLIGTLTVSSNQNEMKTAIAALLSLPNDLPNLDDDITAEKASLMPINPGKSDTGNNIPVPPYASEDGCKKNR